MDYRTQCRMQGASALSFGAAMLAVPAWLVGWFGIDGGLGVEVVGRLCGAMLVALGVTVAAAGDLEDHALQRRVAVANGLVDGGVACIFAVYVGFGLVGSLGWAIVALFAVNCLTWIAAMPRS